MSDTIILPQPNEIDVQPHKSKWKRYEEYRVSGVEWLGEIPSHWQAKKIRRLCQVKRGASPRPIDDLAYFDDDGEYAWVRISDVTASSKYLSVTEQRLSRLGQSKSVCMEPGDIFLSIAATVGKPIIAQIRCCIHDGFVYFSGLKENREYLFYLFSGGELYKGLGKLGTQLNLNTDTVADIYIPLPTIPEQRAIADFLDRETAKIDTLIQKKERLIELLQEKRAALISNAVTKGLDPSVPMKDSGVEWLGQIPEHWEIKRLGIKCTVKARLGWRGLKASEYIDDGYIFISTPNIKETIIDFENVNYISEERYLESPEIMLQVGDVLIAKDGSTLGIVNVVRELPSPATVNSSIAVIRPREPVCSEFLHYFIAGSYTQSIIHQIKNGMGVPHLFQEDLRKFVLLFPPLFEQQVIADFIDKETARIDLLVDKTRRHMEKLREYRNAMISAAVTGKIDVREEVNS